MNTHFIKSSDKKKILEKLNEQFGITNIPYLLIASGKEKIRAYSGHLSKDEIIDMGKLINIEVVGAYLLKEENEEYRLSFDAPIILKNQITKSIVEINKEQFESWIRGNDLDITAEKGVVVIKYQEDFLGSGKSNGEKIFNYVPKDRRLRK